MPADEAEPPSGGDLSRAARRLYAYAVERHSFAEAEATGALGARAAAAITELAAAHLLQRAPGGGPDRWSAVAPRAAAARALAPLALLVRETHDEMDRLRGRLETLVPAYEAGAAHLERNGSGRSELELVTDLGAVRALIAELVAACEKELLTSQPGGGGRWRRWRRRSGGTSRCWRAGCGCARSTSTRRATRGPRRRTWSG